ncbi:MAG: hypothetical protein ACFE0Q_01125 [Anaerolineae bacterium]
MSRWIRFLFVVVLALFSAVAIFAQTAINIGDTVSGSDSDEVAEYSIALNGGQMVEFSIDADWDTYLELYDSNGSLVAFDDDGGEGTLSLLTYTADFDDTYTLRVRAFGQDTPAGDYSLTVSGESAVSVSSTIAIGETISSTADMSEYDIDLLSGQMVEFSIDADWDTYLELYDSAGNLVASDDDGGDGLLSLLEYTATADDTYTLQVRAFASNVPDGDYELTASGGDIIEVATGGDLFVGDTVIGGANGDELVEYNIALKNGQTVQFAIEADWDTYLELYDADGDIVASDDDGGDGLQSLLTYTVENSEIYTIRVRAFGDDVPEGDFELSVEEIEVIALLDGGELSYDDDETVDVDDTLAVEFSFEGAEGDIINVLTRSTEYLSTTVTLFDPQGEDVAESSSYYGDGTILRYELLSSGTYTVQIADSNNGILRGDLTVEVQTTEFLTLDNGAVTVEVGDDVEVAYVNFTAVEDAVYEIRVESDRVPLYSELSINIVEADGDLNAYSDYSLRIRGSVSGSYQFEAPDDDEYVIRVEFYGSDEIDVTVSLTEVVTE